MNCNESEMVEQTHGKAIWREKRHTNTVSDRNFVKEKITLVYYKVNDINKKTEIHQTQKLP